MNTTSDFSTTRKNNSKAFLRELLLDNRLRSVSGFDEKENLHLPQGTVLPSAFPHSDAPVSPGQIRLLSQTAFITYVAVLARWDEESFLIAPFSRFGQPATDEELKTMYDGGAFMRVLQLWNARSAMASTLRKSWLVGTLPEQDVKDALLLWKWSIGDVDKLPGEIEDRTGVPIYRTDDPRLDYRREALEKFAAFDAEDDANVEKVGSRSSTVRINRTKCASKTDLSNVQGRSGKFRLVIRLVEWEQRAAAESLAGNPRMTFVVKGHSAKLRCEYSRSGKVLLFSVWDGVRRVKSDELDGFKLRVEGVAEDVPIVNKSARIPVDDPAAEFSLVNPSGKKVGLLKDQ